MAAEGAERNCAVHDGSCVWGTISSCINWCRKVRVLQSEWWCAWLFCDVDPKSVTTCGFAWLQNSHAASYPCIETDPEWHERVRG